MGYYHLPQQYRLQDKVPVLDRSLMVSGFRILSVWDELAIWGHDVSVSVGKEQADALCYAGYPSQGLRLWGRTKQLENNGFAVGYSEQLNNPLWSAYRVFDVKHLDSGKRPGFSSDKRTKSRVKPGDYTFSGFDRGHMAPNYAIATRFDAEAQKETFLMSNIIPQNPEVNRGIWKDLEMLVAKRYGRYLGEVWVLTGPVFSKPVKRLKSGVAIPSHYYKIIVDENGDQLRAMAFLIAADCPPYTRLKNCLVSIDEIEERTGLNFFHDMGSEVEGQLESIKPTRLWPVWWPAGSYYWKRFQRESVEESGNA